MCLLASVIPSPGKMGEVTMKAREKGLHVSGILKVEQSIRLRRRQET